MSTFCKIFGLVFGLTYYHQTLTEDSIKNINGALFIGLVNASYANIMITTIVKALIVFQLNNSNAYSYV